VVGTGVLWDVSTRCAVVPPRGLYGVVGTGVLWDVSTRCFPGDDRWGVVSTHLRLLLHGRDELMRAWCRSFAGLLVAVHAQHVFADLEIRLRGGLVQHHEHHVESREERVGQRDVERDGPAAALPAPSA
jgi:hypothetical protein